MNKSRLGGLRRLELHGNPGTFAGRSKGGSKTVSIFHKNPNLAKKSRFIIRKEIHLPDKSVDLAEFFGIVLGDGGLSGNHQLTITFNAKSDREYSEYICDLLNKLFSINYFIRKRKDSLGADIIVSRSNLVDFLIKFGLKTGNKVKNQIEVPSWISGNLKYMIACLRGLMDTDGGLFVHRYVSSGKEYSYLKLCFTNSSKPLLKFVFDLLNKLDFKVYLKDDRVFIYAKSEVVRYFSEIGTSNPKHLRRFDSYFVN